MLNLATVLEDSAQNYPDRTALVIGETRLTFAEVNAAANQVASLLVSRGIEPGDRVALAAPNIPWFPIFYYGILKSGAITVPLNILLRSHEIEYHLRDSGAKALIAFEGTAELHMGEQAREAFDRVDACEHFFVIAAPATAHGSAPLAELADTIPHALNGMPPVFETKSTEFDDTAVILYTSGTTGQPKGAELSHGNMMLNALTAHRRYGSGEACDTHLIGLPLFHSFAQTLQLNTAFVSGATVVLMPRFDPAEVLRLFKQERVTHFAGVPTMFQTLVATAQQTNLDLIEAVSHLKFVLSGGAALPVEVIEQVRLVLGVQVLDGYGLSETSPAAALTPPGGVTKPGSIGRPIWGVQMKLIDDDWNEIEAGPEAIGEIAVKGHPVMKGYFGKPEATQEVLRDGWFRTGDLARQDEDGYYFIVDRAKDLIIRGGYNVYPRELEEALLTHPAVAMAAVVGVAHDTLGEEIKAVLVARDGESIDHDELIAWGRERFAGYKYPRIIEVRESLPLTSTGKILKRMLVDA
ncbi:MAG: long-chain-fatty-acid--CoA ligase [Microbacteriaceae bacterium]